jgi:hypothetical protein
MGLYQRSRKPTGWRFCLLIAAWFCANTPQSLVYNLGAWCAGARHFSHQERLKAEAACLLGAKRADVFRVVAAPAGMPNPPPIPEGAVLKRPDLSAETVAALIAPDPARQVFGNRRDEGSGRARLAPLLTPPRAYAIA